MKIEKIKIAGADGSTVEAGYFQTSCTAILQLGNLAVETGKQYTLHGYAKASASATMACSGNSASIGTTWTEFAFLITPDSKTIQLAFAPATWWIYNWKLEVGDIITPWTPSPIDAKNDIEEKSSEWSQTAESIRSEVSRVSNNLDSAKSEWNQTAEGIKSSVSKVSSDLSTAQTEWNQTANEFKAEISKKITPSEVDGKISASASNLTTEYKNAITASEKGLKAEIGKKIGSDEAKTIIEANADSIRTKTGTLVWEAENSSMTEDGTFTCRDGHFGGDLDAAGGTFTGDLSAVGGTFKGDLSAAGGTFKGNLEAAGGSFNGDVTAKSFKTADGVVNTAFDYSYAVNKFDRLVTVHGFGTAMSAISIEGFKVPQGCYPAQQVGAACVVRDQNSKFKLGFFSVNASGDIIVYYYDSYGSGPTRIDKSNCSGDYLAFSLYFSCSWFTNYSE